MFDGWDVPPATAHAPQRMILACDRPGQAEGFYRRTLSTAFGCCDFTTAERPGAAAQWELAVGAADLDEVAARARDHGAGLVTRFEHAGQPCLRLSSPDGLTVQVHPLD